MIFLRKGTLSYSPNSGVAVTDIHQGQWITEHVLWTNWVYHGTLWAKTSCRLLLLDAKMFQELASSSQHEELKLGEYGLEFLKSVNAQLVDDRSDIGSLEECQSCLLGALSKMRNRGSRSSSNGTEQQVNDLNHLNLRPVSSSSRVSRRSIMSLGMP